MSDIGGQLAVYRLPQAGLVTVDGGGTTARLDRYGPCLTLDTGAASYTAVFPVSPVANGGGVIVAGRAISFGQSYALDSVEVDVVLPPEIGRRLAQAGCPRQALSFASASASRSSRPPR